MKRVRLLTIGFVALTFLAGCEYLPDVLKGSSDTTLQQPVVEIEVEPTVSDDVSPIVLPESATLFKRIQGAEWNPAFRFSAEIPNQWEVEYIPQIEALNIYDLNDPAETVREKSQIFIRYFQSDRFLTLNTVNISSRAERLVGGHEAVNYEITKKADVADFAHQPRWRNTTHKLTDVRYEPSGKTYFYVFAYNPTLSSEAFEQFLNSLEFYNDAASFTDPVDRAKERVNKKPFGIYITPESSPVKPERFMGYHNAVDFEVFDNELDHDVEVKAVCGGPLKYRDMVGGYGGVGIQECLLDNEPITVLYGHMKVESLPAVGTFLHPGQPIGVLGKNQSEESGFERRHLHLGFRKGTEIDFRGYTASEASLESWIDPCTVICK